MMTEAPGLAAAFAAGLLSFLSPCVLPLVPGYLSFITGRSASSIKAGSVSRPLVFVRTVFFVLGFTLVFVALGFAFRGAFAIGGARRTLTMIAGAVVVVFGLNTLFEFARFLEIERRFHPVKGKGGPFGAFLLGVAFSAGWSPCVGPMLGSILLYAGRSGTTVQAVALLASYTMGFSLPFLAAGLFFERTKGLLDFFKRHGLAVRVVSGLLLVGLGLAMLLGQLSLLNGVFARAGWALREAAETRPEAARLWALGSYALLFCLSTLLALVKDGLRKRDTGDRSRSVSPDGGTTAASMMHSGKRGDRPRVEAAVPGTDQRGRPDLQDFPDGAAKDPADHRTSLWHPARLVFMALLALAATGEFAGWWKSAEIIAGWLLFQ